MNLLIMNEPILHPILWKIFSEICGLIFYRYMMKMNYSKSSWIFWAKQIWWIMQLTFGSSCIQMRKFQRLV